MAPKKNSGKKGGEDVTASYGYEEAAPVPLEGTAAQLKAIGNDLVKVLNRAAHAFRARVPSPCGPPPSPHDRRSSERAPNHHGPRASFRPSGGQVRARSHGVHRRD